MAVVCAHPHRYPIEEQPDIRRVRLKRFPYNILFRESGNTVQVLAVAHKRRHVSVFQLERSNLDQEHEEFILWLDCELDMVERGYKELEPAKEDLYAFLAQF